MTKAVQTSSLNRTTTETSNPATQTLEMDAPSGLAVPGGIAQAQGVANQLRRTLAAGAGGRGVAQRSFAGLGRQGYSNQQLGQLARMVAGMSTSQRATAAQAPANQPAVGNPTKISQAGIDFIHGWESLRLDAYRDQKGVLTIGWGHTKGVQATDHITKEQADQLFSQDIVDYEAGVTNYVKVPLTQSQFDALVSFSYNLGADILNPATDASNDLINYINTVKDGNFNSDTIRKIFDEYSDAGRPEHEGLLNRRNAEATMFMSGASKASGGNSQPQPGNGQSQPGGSQSGGSSNSNIYTIQSNDTLSGIARKAGVTPDAILNLPQNQDINTLDGKGLTWVTIQTYPEPGNDGKIVHKVEGGDTLTDLAQRYRTSVAAILSLPINNDVDTNCLNNRDHMITLPPGATSPGSSDNQPAQGNQPVSGNGQGQQSGTPDTQGGSSGNSDGADSGEIPFWAKPKVRANPGGRVDAWGRGLKAPLAGHSLPVNYMAHATSGGRDPKAKYPTGQCTWYAASVALNVLNNNAPMLWAGGETTWTSPSGQVYDDVYKGDGGAWYDLVATTPGAGSQTSYPEVGGMISFSRRDGDEWGHIAVVEDVHTGKDVAGADVLVILISEYNINLDGKPDYRYIMVPAPGGSPKFFDMRFLKLKEGYQG